MDKADVKHEAQSDTSSVINMKEYAPSEYPSSEPPPAYMKMRPNSVRIARLAAFTIIASAVILGSFILAASWIQANTARNLDLTLNQELMDDLHPQYEHLVANDAISEQDNSLSQEAPVEKKQQEPQQAQESLGDHQEQEEPDTRQSQSQEGGASLELDAIANVLMQKGMRGNVNCIVEKRRNEELVDHAPRVLNIPGLNISTPPRLQHLTGEQVVIICKDDASSEEKQEDKEQEQEQQMLFPIPPQILAQLQQGSQMVPLNQILQHIQAAQLLQQQQQQQQPIFIPHQPQPQQEQQVFYQHVYQQPQRAYQEPQPIYQHPQQIFHQQQPQPQVFHLQQPQPQVFHQQQPQPQVFHEQQAQPQVFQQPQPQMFQPQVLRQPQQQQMFMSQPQMMYRPQPEPQQEQQQAVPLRQVPLNQLMNQRPINPMAIQDVPINQMPITHMPMREARMPEQPIPVHHLVPPRPQQVRIENFSQDEDELPAMIRQRILQREMPRMLLQREMQREREMPRNVMTEAHPQPLPLDSREPRLMRGPIFPISDNNLPESAPQPMPPRFPSRPFRFPDSNQPEGMAITRIIPIRLEKMQDSDESNSDEEKRPLPIPLNAILDMVFRGIRPLVGRQPFPVPIDIKIERIEKPMMENSSESEESQEDSQEVQEGQEGQDEVENMEEKPNDSSEAKVQQVEIVEKEGENTQAIPIPADAQDAQIFKLEDKPEGEWVGRAFLPNGAGRGGVFPIPQNVREAQIFTVSDARAAIPMTASYEAAPAKEEEAEPAPEARSINFGQPEGEVNLFPVPMNAERSVRLYPVDEQQDKPQPEQKMEPQQPEEAQPHHVVQPRSV